MGLRETINEKPAATAGVAGAIILCVLLLVIRVSCGGGGGGGGGGAPRQAYFTVDDGKTYFPAPTDQIPPFTTSDGKTAYRAVLVRCGSGNPYVSHLERYSPDAKKKLEEAIQNSGARENILAEVEANALSAAEVKKPLTGDKGWLRPGTPQYANVAQPGCPDGSDAERLRP